MLNITVIDKNGEKHEHYDVNVALEEYGSNLSNIIITDPNSGIVNLDNGERIILGDRPQEGKWCCVQGLWMWFKPRADFTNGQIIDTHPRDVLDKYYNRFTLKNISLSKDLNNIYKETVNFITTITVNSDISYFRDDIFVYDDDNNEVCHGVTTREKYRGIIFVVKNFSYLQNKKYPYGYADIFPCLINSSDNQVGLVETYGWSSVDGSNDDSVASGSNAIVSMPFYGAPWIRVPMANENELYFNQGITDKFIHITKKQLEEIRGEDK